MDKQFLHPNLLNANYRLTRAASFSELSTTKKVVFEQRCQSEARGILTKQFSCEQIFDKKTNLSHLTVSRTLKSDDEEHVDIWKSTAPTYTSLKNSECSVQPSLQKQFSISNNYFAIQGKNMNSRLIIQPTKFINNQNRSKEINSNKQNMLQICDKPYNEKDNEPVFQLKKPTLILNSSNVLKSDFNAQNKQKDDSNIINNFNLLEQTNRSICNNKNQQKISTSDLKTRLRSLVKKEPEAKNEKYSCWFLMFIILIPITIVYIAFLIKNTELSNEFCKPHFKFNKVAEELKKYIYGQDAAIDDLIKYFKKRENQTGFDVITFIGSTGVGKSYTAEIIKNNLKDTYNVLEFFYPFHEKENQAYTSLSVCQCNLIRLENIKTDYISDSIQFIDKLNSRVNNYCILILALFNTQETNHNLQKTLDVNKSLSIINKQIENIGLQSTSVTFTTMNNESLIKCIEDAADYNNLELSNDDIEYVKNDLIRADSGCKGAYAKVQLVGKLRNV